MFINFTPFPNAHCTSRTPPSFCWSVTWPQSTSSKAQASHKFTEFPLFHWWPPNLWAIAQDNFTDLVTNNFHFHDPFIGSFNHSYFLFQTVSKNNTPFSALLPTLHHNLYLLPITFFHLNSCKLQTSIQHLFKVTQFHQLSSTMNQHFTRQTGFRPVQREFFLSPKHKCPQILLKDLVYYFWCKQVLVMYPRYFGVTPP